MRATRRLGWLGLVLLLTLGCRTPNPDLKPPKQREFISVPPDVPRFNAPSYPKEAFNNRTYVPLARIPKEEKSVKPARAMGGTGMRGF